MYQDILTEGSRGTLAQYLLYGSAVKSSIGFTTSDTVVFSGVLGFAPNRQFCTLWLQSAVLAVLNKPPQSAFAPEVKKSSSQQGSFAVRGATICSATGEEVLNLLSPRRHDKASTPKKESQGGGFKKIF